MANLRVSVVRYLNTVPLIWGMLHGEQQGKYDLDFTLPANCADAVRQRQADVGIVPAIEYHRMDHVEILSGLSISSKETVRSVLLLSKVPLQKIQSIALDNSSRTSAALVRILMRKFYCRFVTLQPTAPRPDDMLKRADAALLIGDPALTYSQQGLEVFDLAEEWKKHTGLPFVFALWVGHQDLKLGRYRRDFELSRDFGLAHVNDIASEYAPKLKMSVEDVRIYLTQNIDYSLDEENRKGLRLFGKLALEVGIIPTEKELMFV